MPEPLLPPIRAPFTPAQVTALNAYQQAGRMHPFTCGGDHAPGSPALVAYTDGWRCPQPYGEHCNYRQDWAHAFMAEPPPVSAGGEAQTHHDDTGDDRLTVLSPAEYRAAVRRALAEVGLTYSALEAQARDHGGTFTSAQAHSLWMAIGGTVTQEQLDEGCGGCETCEVDTELAQEREAHQITKAELDRYVKAETDKLKAKLADIQARAFAPLPSGEEIAEWDAADKETASKIRAARPGIPLHHVYAVLQTLRVVQPPAPDVDAYGHRGDCPGSKPELTASQRALAEDGELPVADCPGFDPGLACWRCGMAEGDHRAADAVLREAGLRLANTTLADSRRFYAAQVARVEGLHQPYRSVYDERDQTSCAHCNQLTGGRVPWPCDTARAIQQEEN